MTATGAKSNPTIAIIPKMVSLLMMLLLSNAESWSTKYPQSDVNPRGSFWVKNIRPFPSSWVSLDV
jgi:hypothetical protein